MKTTNSLPKYWVVKSDISNSNWKKVITYLNKIYGRDWYIGTDNAYYGFDGSTFYKGTNVYHDLSSFKNTPTILTIEEFVEMTEGNVIPEYVECIKSNTGGFIVNKIYKVKQLFDDKRFDLLDEQNNERNVIIDGSLWSFKKSTKEAFDKQQQKPKETMKTITHTQAQQIIDIACAAWKDRLATKWGRKIVFKETIEISDNDYQEMRKACTSEQNKLFDEIFGKDVKFKVGDWVMFEGSFGNAGPYQIKSFTTNGSALDQNGEWRDIQSQYRLATEEEIQKAQFIPKGTACLVRDGDAQTWKFAYSNGNGEFKWYERQEDGHTWNQVQVLDMNNLPKY